MSTDINQSLYIKHQQILQKVEMFIGVICLFSLLVIMLANAAGRYLLSNQFCGQMN